jgi:hypothetical protein
MRKVRVIIELTVLDKTSDDLLKSDLVSMLGNNFLEEDENLDYINVSHLR